MRNNKKGFTLVELLVVIAILAILASVAVVGYTAFIEKAEKSNAQTEAHQIKTAIEASLMVNDCVIVRVAVAADAEGKGEVKGIYAQKDAQGNVTFHEGTPTATDADNIAANFVDFASKLSVVGTNLIYTSADNHKVNVLAGTIVAN